MTSLPLRLRFRLPSLACTLLLAACSGSDPAAGGGPPTGLAVIGSDYHSVSVPLADPATGAITREGCITSGSTAPGLTTALSGDVVLPSQPQPGHELLLIDRTNATLTWVDPQSCAVLRQLNVGEGMAANPHDVIAVSAHKAYVTRYVPAASDLLIIDPAAATILGRIDLAAQSTRPDGNKPARALPDRGVRVGGRVLIALNELSDDFMSGGPARLVVVDPAVDQVVGTVDVPELQNCGQLAVLADAPTVAVGCGGVFGAPDQLAASGVALIELASTPPAVTLVRAGRFGLPVSSLDLVVLSRAAAFTVVPGDFSGRADSLWTFDFDGGTPRKVLDGSGPFHLGGLVAQVDQKKLFLGDAAEAEPRILVIDTSDAASPAVQSPIPVSGLPPRALGLY
jgi:hypothetical protein